MTVFSISTMPLVRQGRRAVRAAAVSIAATVLIAACSSGTSDDSTSAGAEQQASPITAPPATSPAAVTTVSAPPAITAPSSTGAPSAPTTIAPDLVTATSTLGDVPVTFTVPDGWNTGVEGAVLKGEPEYGVLFWGDFDRIYTDSCPSTMIDPPPGPTVDEFASAWADLPAFEATAPIDVSIDGYAGKLVEFTVPDYDEAECPYGDFMLMGTADGDGYWAQAPNGHHQLRILDVDGTRLVVTAFWYPDTSAEDRAAIADIIDSIQIG